MGVQRGEGGKERHRERSGLGQTGWRRLHPTPPRSGPTEDERRSEPRWGPQPTAIEQLLAQVLAPTRRPVAGESSRPSSSACVVCPQDPAPLHPPWRPRPMLLISRRERPVASHSQLAARQVATAIVTRRGPGALVGPRDPPRPLRAWPGRTLREGPCAPSPSVCRRVAARALRTDLLTGDRGERAGRWSMGCPGRSLGRLAGRGALRRGAREAVKPQVRAAGSAVLPVAQGVPKHGPRQPLRCGPRYRTAYQEAGDPALPQPSFPAAPWGRALEPGPAGGSRSGASGR